MMNPSDADLRSQTYRERLTVDFTNQIKSSIGGYQTSQLTALVESLVDSAMGPVDALIDEMTEVDVKKILDVLVTEAEAKINSRRLTDAEAQASVWNDHDPMTNAEQQAVNIEGQANS